MKIYTRKGDDGTTSLVGGKRVPKQHLRVEAYGSVDELIAWTGLLRDHPANTGRKEILVYIQDQLMRTAATLATDPSTNVTKPMLPHEDAPRRLEEEIDLMESELAPLSNFILPGGHQVVSYCHIARCVCRRAERNILRLNEIENCPEIIKKFVNRLSDFLFVLSRKLGNELGAEEIKWTV